MAFTLKIEATKDGKTFSMDVPNFPTDLAEASAKYGEDAVYAGFVRSYVIALQAKMRAETKTGGRTKTGSAIDQARQARMQAASLEAANS
jgi:hypothetical protein